jgi:hypothetical protein
LNLNLLYYNANLPASPLNAVTIASFAQNGDNLKLPKTIKVRYQVPHSAQLRFHSASLNFFFKTLILVDI